MPNNLPIFRLARSKEIAKVLLISSILQEPLACLNNMLPVLIIKQLGAKASHISTLTSLLPTVAIFSFYWGAILKQHPTWIKKNLLLATFFAAFCFVLSPVFYNPWFFVFAASIYTLFWRAANPAQMEILKMNIPKEEREILYSRIYKTSYAAGMVIGPILGIVIDIYSDLWRELFMVAAVCYMVSIFLQSRLPISDNTAVSHPPKSLRSIIKDPLFASIEVLRKNLPFRHFQIGFFLGGFGLMLARPSCDFLLVQLDFSYSNLFVCRSLLKGFGIIIAAKFWGQYLKNYKVLNTAAIVLFGFMLYTLLIISANFVPFSIFIAYFIYGIAQSGSHLVWNLSGTLLSGKESSFLYSAINTLAVGIRGAIAPLLGGMLFALFGSTLPLLLGALFMAFASFYFYRYSHFEELILEENS